jgi:protein-tyrosine-phosphatase
MAEFILRKMIKDRKIKWWDISSCGINADVDGTISDNSRQALSEIGIDVQSFKPRQLNQKLIENSEVVITMTSLQKQMLDGCGNILCISEFCGYEICDPYGKDIFSYRLARHQIEQACERIIDEIITKSN